MIRSKRARTAVLCVLTAICLMFFTLSLTMLKSNDTVIASADAYTQISADRADGYTAYSGITTPAGLKKNLTVTGTTDGGVKVILQDSEYEIEIRGGAQIIDGAITADEGAAEFNAIVKCGSATSDIVIPITAEAPDLSGEITVTVNGSGITDDYTADTVYKVLEVRAGETVLTPDLYTVEMGDIYINDLSGSSTASITVKVHGSAQGKTISVNVTKAPLVSVDLRVKPQYTLATDGRYKDENGHNVFVIGENHKSVFEKLEIVAVFANGSRTLTPKFDTQNRLDGMMTGENASSSLSASASANENVTVSVTRGGKTVVSQNLSILFSDPEIIKIEVNQTALAQWNAHNGSDRTIYPYTSLTPSEMKGDDGAPVFRAVRNDGADENVSNLMFDGSLVLDAKSAQNMTDGAKYNKTIKVVSSYNDKVSAEIEIKNISFEAPEEIEIIGSYAQQIAHREPDLSGLSLILYYVDEDKIPIGDTQIPLTESGAVVTPTVTTILLTTKYLGLEVNYNGLTATKRASTISVDKDRIDLPMTDLSVINYTKGCKKTFENFDSDTMDMEVFYDSNCSMPAEDTACSISGSDVLFHSGGTYYIRIGLKKGDIPAEDGTLYPSTEFMLYYEGSTPTGVNLSNDYSYAVYTIQINKAALAVNLEKDAGDIFYGDNLRSKFTVKGTTNGITNLLSELGVSYQLIYVRDGDTSFDYDSLAYDENYREPAKLDAGNYTVYAVTQETAAYLAGKVRENKGAKLTIKPKQLSGEGLGGTKEYNRKAFDLSDFINYGGFVSGETADQVLETVGITLNGAEVERLEFAGEYTVTVALKKNANGGYNYIWSDETYDNQQINVEITKKEFGGFGVSLAKSEFYYGAVTLRCTPYNGNDAYFRVNTSDYKIYKGADEVTGELNALSVGTYKVVYTVSAVYASGEGNTDGVPNDFVLPKAEAQFTVKPAEIEFVTFDGWTFGKYKPDGYKNTITNWNQDLINGASDVKAYEGLEAVANYTSKLGENSTLNPEIGSMDGIVKFTDAGDYKIVISLKDGNYVWVDGTNGDITYSFSIDRKLITEPGLPASITYNGYKQTVELTNQPSSEYNFITYTVTGTSLAAKGKKAEIDGYSFKVTYAGDYKLVFTIDDEHKNNYGWASNEDNAQYEANYYVQQALLTVSWSLDTQNFDDTLPEQEILTKPTAVGVGNDNLVISGCRIYTDSECKNEITKITQAGTYYIRVIGFGGDNSGNYKLDYINNDVTHLVKTYTIVAQGVKIPVLVKGDYSGALIGDKAVTVIYKGGEYYITEFFENAHDNYDLGEVGFGRLKIESAALKDVNSYTVKVSPAGNYTWEGKDGDSAKEVIEYTFTINRKEIGFVWGQYEYTYDGTAKTPQASVTGLVGADNVGDVEISIAVSKIDAGEYGINFSDFSLTGTRAGNYQLTGTVDKKLLIKRAVAEKPSASASEEFNEAKQNISFTVPQKPALTVRTDGVGITDGSYSYSNGEFTFLHAGVYTIEFTLNDKNYCWDSSQEKIFSGNPAFENKYTHTLTVDRLQVKAPALEGLRAVEQGSADLDAFRLANEQNVNTLYAFGTYANDQYTVIDGLTKDDLSRQVYFVQMTLSPNKIVDTFNILASDYQWIVNGDDADSTKGEAWGYLTAAGGKYGKIENGTVLYLCFVVTRSQVEVTFGFNDYVFGANGWDKNGNPGDKSIADGEFTLGNIEGQSSNLISIITNKVTPGTAHKITVKFYTDSEGKNLADGLVNGLPWSAGTYYAKIEVTFDGEDAPYQDLTRTCMFEVSKRALIIGWEDKAEAVYNGAEQTRTPSISNLRYSSSGLLDTVPELTVLTDGIDKKPVNVKYSGSVPADYNLVVSAVSGGDYTAENGENLSSTFKITPESLAVTAKDITHVYGNSLNYLTNITAENYSNFFEITNGTIYNGEYGCISLRPAGVNDKYGSPEVGGKYTLTPVLTNSYGNYALSAAEESNLTVEKREINVTYTGSLSHVYGNSCTLNGEGETASTNNEGVYGKGRSADNVFELYLSDSQNNRVSDYSTAPAGGYTVKLNKLDEKNYTLNFTDADYEIGLAEITGASAAGYTGAYDGRKHEAIINAGVQNVVNNQPVTWWVSKDGGEYKKVNSEEGKVINATDSGDYKVKVTAPNHADCELDGTVRVSISKVTVTVCVNINIYYGETGPDEHGAEAGKWFAQSFEQLVKTGGIYTVTGFVSGTNDERDFRNGTLAGLTGKDTFSYGYGADAYTQGDAYGNYALVFDNGSLSSDNYDFVGGASNLSVSKLPVTVLLKNLTAVYNQENPPAVKEAIVSITTSQVSVYDGQVIEVYGADDFDNIIVLATSALTAGEGRTTNKVGTYKITVQSSSSNYDRTYAYEGGESVKEAVYVITKAQNALDGEYGLFVSAYSSDEALDESSSPAWIYGLAVETQTDGYDAEGAQKAVEAEFIYREHGEQTKYSLYKGETLVKEAQTLAGLLSGGLGAGDYTVKIHLDAGDNYEAVDADRYFRIGKRSLSVTAQAQTVRYGDEAPEYGYTVEGYAATEAGKEDITVFGDNVPAFSCAYIAGADTGSYDIVKSVGETELANYTVMYTDSTLTAEKREVTIIIESKQSAYSYYNETDKKPRALTYAISSGDFFSGDIIGADQLKTKVFTLVTTAYNADGTTEHVGKYPIYAVFANETYQANYQITIVAGEGGNLYEEAFEADGLVIGGGEANTAGIYTITPAALSLSISKIKWFDGTYHDYADGINPNIYDGRQKGIIATAKDDSLGKTFTAKYRKEGTDEYTEELPKNVGSYDYIFVSSDSDYSYDTSGLQLGFEIYPAPLTISYGNNTVNNGWTQSETYKNADFELDFIIGGLVEASAEGVAVSDKISLNAPSIVTSYPEGVDIKKFGSGFNPFASMTSSVDTENGKFTLTARNAGSYEVTLALDNSELMKNYHFGTGYSTRSITFTFSVLQKAHTVNSINANVEYGTQISADGAKVNRFSGFDLTQDTKAVVEQENGFEAGVRYFITDNVTYSTLREGSAYSANGSSHGYVYNVTPAGAYAYNYKLTYGDRGELEVGQRNITIKLKGIDDGNTLAQTDYDGTVKSPSAIINDDNVRNFLVYVNEYAGDANSEYWYGGAVKDAGKILGICDILLSIDNSASDAGYYEMSISQRNRAADYNITFENWNEQPRFRINKIKLTVQAVGAESGNKDFNITYGDTVDGYFGVRYNGFIEKDGNDKAITTDKYEGELSYSASASMRDYTAWVSHAGEKYTVTVTGLTFTNYEVEYKSAVMTVVSRKIAVETGNRVYTEVTENGKIIYYNGEHGINHIAPVIFKDVDGNHNNAGAYVSCTVEGNEFLNSGKICIGSLQSNTSFKLQYSLNGASWTDTAPDTAKEYRLKITLQGADFVFDTVNTKGTAENPVVEGTQVTSNSVTFVYEIKQKELSVSFEDKETEYYEWNSDADLGVKNISVKDFADAIMKADYVQRDNDDLELYETAQPNKGGYYVIGSDGLGLTVYPDGVGLYTAIITIKPSAQENYLWANGGSNVSITFSISSDILRILGLDISDWIYSEYDEEYNKVEIEYDQPTKNLVFAYQYWEYSGEIPSEVSKHDIFYKLDGFTGSQAFKSSLPVNAGTYILKAQYTGGLYTTSTAYCIFDITPKSITAPEFIAEQTERNVKYNAKPHKAVIGYNSSAIDYTYAQGDNGDGTAVRSGNELTITATNADTYTLSFRLTDTRNYVWAEGTDGDNGAYKLEWKIAKASDNTVEVGEISAEYGDGYEVSAVSKYGGEFTFLYAVRGETESKPSAGAVWKESKPVYAGNYWIKAICGETPNFMKSENSGKLTINKAVLTAVPFGNMTYGDGFANGFKDISYTGWKGAEHGVTADVTFAIEGHDMLSLLEVLEGGYVLTVTGDIAVNEQYEEENVYGVDIDNYVIVIEKGVFTVDKKSVEVTIGDLTVVYGEDFDADRVTLTGESLKELVGSDKDDPFTALNITPYAVGEKTSGYYSASSYRIESEGHRDSRNYDVTVRSGLFVVERLEVYVTVEAGGGEYGNVTGARVVATTTKDGEDVNEKFGNVAPAFGFLYSGTSNKGQTINNSAVVPSDAGNYTAVARITNYVGNYALLTDEGNPSVTFIIARKSLDESAIGVEELKYNNADQSPVIVDERYFELYTAEQTTCKEVGSYTVTLTLKDADNYKWSTVEGGEYKLAFTVDRGDNEFTAEVTIEGWNYGGGANLPQTETLFGDSADYVFTYSSEEDGEYTRTVPASAGTYWVKVTVPQSDNYNEKTSAPVKFVIGKRAVKAPVLELISEGENANTVYTGSRLQSAVKDYDPVIMRIIYEGDLSSAGTIAVYAVNAGEYTVYFALNDADNYMWENGTDLSGGNARIVWNVARKKIDKPVMNTSLYMVNGGTLTFIPDGFDENTMTISGNTTSYGGAFGVTVSIKDKVNFEWADGTADDITFDWIVVGWDTVFIIVVSVLAVVGGLAGVAIGVQYGLHRRRKRAQAVSEAAAESAFKDSVTAMENGGDVPPDDGGSEPPAEEEEPSFDEPAPETEENNNDGVEQSEPEQNTENTDNTEEGGENNE